MGFSIIKSILFTWGCPLSEHLSFKPWLTWPTRLIGWQVHTLFENLTWTHWSTWLFPMGPDCFSMRSQTKLPSYIKMKHAPLKEVSHLAIVQSPHGFVNGCILSSKILKVMMDLKQLQSLFRVKKNITFLLRW